MLIELLGSIALAGAQAPDVQVLIGGRALGLIGDVDRDGVVDYAIVRGETGKGRDWRGAASIRSGRDDLELLRFEIGSVSMLEFVQTCEDVDGDGLGEVLTQSRSLRIFSSAKGQTLYERDDARLIGCPGDYDGDGKREVVVVVSTAGTNDGRIELRSLAKETCLEDPDLVDWARGVTCGDFDQDGFVDRLVRPQDADGLALVSGRTGRLEWRIDVDIDASPDGAALTTNRDADGKGDVIVQLWGSDKCFFLWSTRIKVAGPEVLHAVRGPLLRDNVAFQWVGDVDGDGTEDCARLQRRFGRCGLDTGEVVELRTKCGARQAWATPKNLTPVFFKVNDRDADGIAEVVSSDVNGGIVVLSGKTGKQLKRYTL